MTTKTYQVNYVIQEHIVREHSVITSEYLSGTAQITIKDGLGLPTDIAGRLSNIAASLCHNTVAKHVFYTLEHNAPVEVDPQDVTKEEIKRVGNLLNKMLDGPKEESK